MISFNIDGIEYRVFDHICAVSRCGKILRKYQPYTPTQRGDGYLAIGRQRLMHRVVATCWVENPNEAKHVHHINGDKTDHRADNLEWLTPKEHFGDRHNGVNGRYIRTEETRKKLSVWRTGRKDTAETAAKKAAILAVHRPNTHCSFQGVSYPSVAAGGRAANIPPSTFRQRALSKNFPEYKIFILP